MICPNCGQENSEGFKFCVKCGKGLVESGAGPLTCPACGKENAQGALFCAHCGASLGAPKNEVGFTNPPGSSNEPPYQGPYASNIALDIIFSIITCGIYWFFWQARQIRALNYMLREERFSFLLWFLLTIATCGLFNIYYEYIMAQGIVEVQRREGKPITNELPVLSLVLSIFGLHMITDAIQQNEINKLVK